jgi:DNA-binding LacI/PurR family transcriptional regulator
VTGRARGNRAVLADVARAAGVSLSTASKILNDAPGVSVRGETRRRVLAVAAELGYRAHVTARALAGGASHALALLVPELANPAYATMIRSAFFAARELGYTVLVAEDLAGRESVGELIAAGQVDGVLVASARPGHPLPAELDRQGVPHVFVNRPVPGSGRNVTMNDAGAAALAVAHLAGLRHRLIGHVAGPRNLENGRTRALAVRATAREHGLTTPISHAPYTEAGGAAATEALLRRYPGLTALYSGSLRQAVGVLHALRGRGLSVPGDLSVLASDDLPLAAYLSPPLDTIAMPLAELGEVAVRAVVEQINGGTPQDVLIAIRPRLIRRGSTDVVRQGVPAPTTVHTGRSRTAGG